MKVKSDELQAQIETFNGVMADDYAEVEERFTDMNTEYVSMVSLTSRVTFYVEYRRK